jgi:hypothetical protein
MNKKFHHLILNTKGQVAIFVALIFPVLFLFFAMIVNVGLLVHHKINLQNSVDIAAYYGAAKQAEMLNGIGHINYQIRQSWKLLSWRYRQLGTAGDYLTHPYNKRTLTISPDDFEGLPQGLQGTKQDYYDAPAFCITYSPFHPMPTNETTCKQQSTMETVKLFTPPPVIAGFMALNQALADASKKALESATDRCKFVGQFNYFILAEFLVAFNRDQGERKQLINMLSRGLSEAPDNFREINGELAGDGIKTTLENNLTEANKSKESGLKVTVVNGLGLDGCNANGVASTQAAKFLSEVKVSPSFAFMDSLCDAGIVPKAKELGNVPEVSRPKYEGLLHAQIENLAQYIGQMAPPYNSSVGFEKNPWCMAYVGVKAETKPNIPFMPLNGVTLKAQAYAKPFGGKIGPWYMSQWASGSPQSNGGKRTDPLLPIRLDDKGNLANYKDPTRAPNYSRFVGDTAGMKSRAVQGQWGRAIYNLDAQWSGLTTNAVFDERPPGYKPTLEPNFDHWSHLQDDFNTKKTGDILAWDNTQNSYPRMRSLEIAAILPDVFDLTYYSIEPDFYHNYYKKISEEYVKKVPGFSYLIRPDLGSRLGNKDLTEFSVREQFKSLDLVKTDNPQIHEPKVDFEKKITYVAKEVAQVLTSWIGKDLQDYSLDTDRFGKCLTKPLKNGNVEVPTSGDCVVGGRTGYSVKMVSSEYLESSDLDLGGENTSPGKIINLPPK